MAGTESDGGENGSNDGNGRPPERLTGWLAEYWTGTPGCYLGVAIVVIALLLTALAWLATRSDAWLSIGLGTAVAVAALVALRCRLAKRQHQYLNRIGQERAEIEALLELLGEFEEGALVASLPDAGGEDDDGNGERDEEGARGDDGGVGADGTPTIAELRWRLEIALDDLEAARRAVYRSDFADFLALFYRASRQKVLLYELLERLGVAEWTIGLDDDEVVGPRIGMVEKPAAEATRSWNLARRLRSFGARSLPPGRMRLVDEYLATERGELKDATAWELLYAVRTLHDWNVDRYERGLYVKRLLRCSLGLLVVILVALAILTNALMDTGVNPLFDTVGNAAPTDVSGTDESARIFLWVVPVIGALGAMFSMVVTIRGESRTGPQTSDPSILDPTYMVEGLLARLLVGSVSALVLFAISLTTLAPGFIEEVVVSDPITLLLVAFAAGFSERWARAAIEEIVNGGLEDDQRGDDAGDARASPARAPPDRAEEDR